MFTFVIFYWEALQSQQVRWGEGRCFKGERIAEYQQYEREGKHWDYIGLIRDVGRRIWAIWGWCRTFTKIKNVWKSHIGTCYFVSQLKNINSQIKVKGIYSAWLDNDFPRIHRLVNKNPSVNWGIPNYELLLRETPGNTKLMQNLPMLLG